MNAQQVLELWGGSLVGMIVHTPAMGDYPGGIAKVTEVLPDPSAEEILFIVEHPKEGKMGIYYFKKARLAGNT